MSSLKPSCDLFIFVGEPSGDALGADLLRALFEQNPHLSITAVAGPGMRRHPISTLYPMEDFQVMGFWEVLKNLRKLTHLFKKIVSFLLTSSPKAIVLIDYPGFNLRLARRLRKGGYKGKLIHYVCPSIWAWKKKRIHTLCNTLDLLLCIFPFEKALFAHSLLPVKYLGHPLISSPPSPQIPHPLPPLDLPLLTIFPGSRPQEILRNLPFQLEACATLAKSRYTIAISYASPHLLPLLQKEILRYPSLSILTFPGVHNPYFMQRSTLALATSGTITLELALYSVPTLVSYRMRWLDSFLARHIFRIRLPHYCIANYSISQRIFPEFYGPHCKKRPFYDTLAFFLDTPEERDLCRERCRLIRQALFQKDPSLQAAHTILSLL